MGYKITFIPISFDDSMGTRYTILNSYFDPKTCLHEISQWFENTPKVHSICIKLN